MALHARLVGSGDNGIAIHAFSAALREWQVGALSRAQIVATFDLTSGDESDLDFIKGKFQASADKEAFGQSVETVLILGEARLFGYDDEATFVARVTVLP